MTLRHLEILREAARTGSFTQAAQTLYLTQSAVSHAIRELEEQAGTVLFDRLSKSVRLTSAGQRLLEQAAPILRSMQSLEAGLEELEREAPIQLASSITIGAYWLPRVLRDFSVQWPRVPVQVEVVSAANAVAVLRSGQADLALIEGSVPPGPFRWEAFAGYEIGAFCAPGHVETDRPWSLAELAGLRLLLREPGSAIRDALDSALFLAGLTARPAWVSVNSTALVEAARAGLGVAVLPRMLVEDALAQGTLVELALPGLRLQNQLLAVWHRDKHWNQPQKTLLELVTGAAADGTGLAQK